MTQFKFKSNINCGSCIQKVTPTLNTLEGVDDWHVDTTHPGKILTVEVENLDKLEIVSALEKIGFSAEPYDQD